MSIFQNTCKPVGVMGKLMLSMMNIGHKKLHKWGFKQIEINDHDVCLDIGCGGGTNLKRILKSSPTTVSYGIDYSEESIKKSTKKCKKYIREKRCYLAEMNVLDIKFNNEMFNLVTAFETIYFWGNLDRAFKNVYNIMKDGGKFLICNESDGKVLSQEKWCNKINGMKIYKIDEIKVALENAGFKDIKIIDNKEPWLSIIATK